MHEIKKELESQPETSSEEIEQAAKELEQLNFSPTFILGVPNFIRMTKSGILGKIDEVAAYPKEKLVELGFSPAELEDNGEKKKLTQMKIMLYHFKLLTRLRKNEPEAWDEVNELYEED